MEIRVCESAYPYAVVYDENGVLDEIRTKRFYADGTSDISTIKLLDLAAWLLNPDLSAILVSRYFNNNPITNMLIDRTACIVSIEVEANIFLVPFIRNVDGSLKSLSKTNIAWFDKSKNQVLLSDGSIVPVEDTGLTPEELSHYSSVKDEYYNLSIPLSIGTDTLNETILTLINAQWHLCKCSYSTAPVSESGRSEDGITEWVVDSFPGSSRILMPNNMPPVSVDINKMYYRPTTVAFRDISDCPIFLTIGKAPDNLVLPKVHTSFTWIEFLDSSTKVTWSEKANTISLVSRSNRNINVSGISADSIYMRKAVLSMGGLVTPDAPITANKLLCLSVNDDFSSSVPEQLWYKAPHFALLADVTNDKIVIPFDADEYFSAYIRFHCNSASLSGCSGTTKRALLVFDLDNFSDASNSVRLEDINTESLYVFCYAGNTYINSVEHIALPDIAPVEQYIASRLDTRSLFRNAPLSITLFNCNIGKLIIECTGLVLENNTYNSESSVVSEFEYHSLDS